MEVVEVQAAKRRKKGPLSAIRKQVGGKGEELLRDKLGWDGAGLGVNSQGRTSTLRLKGAFEQQHFDFNHFSGVYGRALASVTVKADDQVASNNDEPSVQRVEWWTGFFVRANAPLVSIPLLTSSKPVLVATPSAGPLDDNALFAKCEGRRGRRSHLANSNGVVARKMGAAGEAQPSAPLSTEAATAQNKRSPVDVEADALRRRERRERKRLKKEKKAAKKQRKKDKKMEKKRRTMASEKADSTSMSSDDNGD